MPAAHCHAVHEVIEGLRSRFGERMRYVFRHLPVAGSEDAIRAAELAEYAAETTGRFWEVHEALMERGPAFSEGDFERIARDFNLPPSDAAHEPAFAAAQARVREDIESARRSGARVTPTFFINGRRYAGTWDESSLADAMLGSLGHRIQSAAFEFVRWGPSSGSAPGAGDGARAGAQQLAPRPGVRGVVGDAPGIPVGRVHVRCIRCSTGSTTGS